MLDAWLLDAQALLAFDSTRPRIRFESSATGAIRMNDDLSSKTCTPCRGGVEPLARAEAESYLVQAPGWALVDEGRRIERSFKFKNFKEAMDFVAKIGNLSESEGHHPDISFGWGWAKVSWQTKKIKGLHENDFIMAAKTNELHGA
jgi:4a-hydroxytetrahydrobiopterin dehydratase